MSISHFKLRQLFAQYWQKNKHKELPSIPLVPKDDPTTLFTGSGMQQLIPYFLGETHPLGKRLYNVQRCFRALDIEEVGDNRHTTMFEMMGNWSLGDYFKEEQLKWSWQFLTEIIKLPKEKLYVTVFSGTKDIQADDESYSLWKKIGVKDDHIYKYGPEKNWWSRAGTPSDMPSGEPGGPDSEVFYEFTQILHNKKYGQKCHPNCQCGRFMEIGNSVFIQYKKNQDGSFSELPAKNVDFGGGLERIISALENNPDIFSTSLYLPITQVVEKVSNKKYSEDVNKPLMRIIIDHLKAATFMVNEGLEPANKEQGYVLRRLLRRTVVKMLQIGIIPLKDTPKICESIINTYKGIYFDDKSYLNTIKIKNEMSAFLKTVDKGTKLLQTTSNVDGRLLFNLKQSYGFPLEIALELLDQWGKLKNKKKLEKEFKNEFKKHQELSRSASTEKFKGGLANQSEKTIKFHTASHLIHQALYDVLGKDIKQEGSNITSERLRFDFSSLKRPTDEEIKRVNQTVNDKIKEKLPVEFKIMPKKKAYELEAKSFFREKYPDMVKVYFVDNYSKEFCGGPHVKNTAEIGQINVYKFEKIGSNLYRVYAK